MRDKLVMALLVSITAGVAGAQVVGSSSSDTNVLRSVPATNQVATSSGNLTNTFQPGPAINQVGSFGLGPVVGEPTGLGMKLWLSDKLAVGGGVGWSFEDLDLGQVKGACLARAS
jgi:hypothetical protein